MLITEYLSQVVVLNFLYEVDLIVIMIGITD